MREREGDGHKDMILKNHIFKENKHEGKRQSEREREREREGQRERER